MSLMAIPFLVACLVRLAPPAPSLDEAEKNIVERFNAIQSLAATVTNEETQEKDGKKTSVPAWVASIAWNICMFSTISAAM